MKSDDACDLAKSLQVKSDAAIDKSCRFEKKKISLEKQAITYILKANFAVGTNEYIEII